MLAWSSQYCKWRCFGVGFTYVHVPSHSLVKNLLLERAMVRFTETGQEKPVGAVKGELLDGYFGIGGTVQHIQQYL